MTFRPFVVRSSPTYSVSTAAAAFWDVMPITDASPKILGFLGPAFAPADTCVQIVLSSSLPEGSPPKVDSSVTSFTNL